MCKQQIPVTLMCSDLDNVMWLQCLEIPVSQVKKDRSTLGNDGAMFLH